MLRIDDIETDEYHSERYRFLERIAEENNNQCMLDIRLGVIFGYLEELCLCICDEYADMCHWDFFRFYVLSTPVELYHIFRLDKEGLQILDSYMF